MRGGELDQRAAPLDRECAPARVLEGGDGVEEARAATGELAVEGIQIEAFLVHLNRHDLRAEARELLERPVVGGRLDEHPPRPLRQELFEPEGDSLEAAARDDDSRGLDSVALAEPFAERPVPPARAVAEHRSIGLDGGAGAVADQLCVQTLRRRRATGKGDHGMSLTGASATLIRMDGGSVL